MSTQDNKKLETVFTKLRDSMHHIKLDRIIFLKAYYIIAQAEKQVII
jgi:hypothetical protein